MAAILPSPILREAPPTVLSPKHEFQGHKGEIMSFVFLQDNVHIVSGSVDGTMRKWNCETGLLVGEPWKGETAVYALALSPDGRTIACGRGNGTVEQRDTNGQIMKDILGGHSDLVRSLSWSPSGKDIASGSYDGTILIRNAKTGQLKLGPIKASQKEIFSIAYSPSGDRIASGGWRTICVWDSHTGKLLVGPIVCYRPGFRDLVPRVYWLYWTQGGMVRRVGLGPLVRSVVWSLDGRKLYCASDFYERVFDSTSGSELHHFRHDGWLRSIALSPTHNVRASVGDSIAVLWDTESQYGYSFQKGNRDLLVHVSFSPDGRYLAYGGYDRKITLRIVEDLVSVLHFSTNAENDTQQDTLLKSASPEVDAANHLAQSAVDNVAEEVYDNPYDQFFTSSKSSLPLPSSYKRRFFLIHSSRNDSIRSHTRLPHSLFSHRVLSNSPSHVPANSEHTKSTPKGKCRAENEDEEHDDDIHCPVNVAPSNDKGKQREESISHMQTSSSGDPSSPAELDSDGNRTLWKLFMRARKKDGGVAPAMMTQEDPPKIVDVYPIRVPQGIVALEPKSKRKGLRRPMTSFHIVPTHATNSSQAGSSSRGDTVHAHISSEGRAGPSSQSTIAGYAGQSSQAPGGNGVNDWSIDVPWNKFLDKLCYPCGHFHDDDDDT